LADRAADFFSTSSWSAILFHPLIQSAQNLRHTLAYLMR
jgi:hypothetical protein